MFDITLKPKSTLEVLNHIENNFLKDENNIIKLIEDIFPIIEKDISIFFGTRLFDENTSPYEFLQQITQWYYEVNDKEYQIFFNTVSNKYELQEIFVHSLNCGWIIECKGSELLKNIPGAYQAFSYVISTLKYKANADMQCLDDSYLTNIELEQIKDIIETEEYLEEELNEIKEIQKQYSKDGEIHIAMNTLYSEFTYLNSSISDKINFKSIDKLKTLIVLANDLNKIPGTLMDFYHGIIDMENPDEYRIGLPETINIVWDEESLITEHSNEYIQSELNEQGECDVKEFLSYNQAPSQLPILIQQLLEKLIDYLRTLHNDAEFKCFIAKKTSSKLHSKKSLYSL